MITVSDAEEVEAATPHTLTFPFSRIIASVHFGVIPPSSLLHLLPLTDSLMGHGKAVVILKCRVTSKHLSMVSEIPPVWQKIHFNGA